MKSYTWTVCWIAKEDNPEDTDVDSVRGTLTVQMAADIYGKPAAQVAQDVVGVRTRSFTRLFSVAAKRAGIDLYA